jgi:fluoroquinolone resistance protein
MSFSKENYYQENFTKLSLSDEIKKSITYEECVFDGCTFINTKFLNCRFISCKFTECILSAVSPMDCRLIDISFYKCKTIGIDWTKTQQFREIVFKNCQLNYSNFKLLKIPDIKITDCEVKDADFAEADLSNCDFKNTDFENSRFFKTNLSNANFKGARNYSIDLGNNTLKKTRFSYPEALSLLNGLDIIIE